MATKTSTRKPVRTSVRAGKALGKGLRGTYRAGRKWGRNARERKRARKENRETTAPTPWARARKRLAQRGGAAATCISCGGPSGTGHVCGEKKVDHARRQAAATLDKKAARQRPRASTGTTYDTPDEAANVREFRRKRREARKALPWKDRIKATARLAKDRARGKAAKCTTCRTWLRPEEFNDHRCRGPSTPKPAAAPPPPNKPSTPSPSRGSNTKRRPPVATSNGKATAALSEFPANHEEMVAKMIAAKAEYYALSLELEGIAARLRDKSALIHAFATTMVQSGFNPVCAQPLAGASDRVREAAGKVTQGADHIAESTQAFLETVIVIEKVYAALLAAYRNGTAPKASYFAA